MLFNADRAVKDSLFQMYKKDAMEHASRKTERRTQQIQEERTYLENLRKREQEEEEKQKYDKMQKRNLAREEYYQMMQKKDLLKKTRLDDVNFNTYGVSEETKAPTGENEFKPSLYHNNQLNLHPSSNQTYPTKLRSPNKHEVSKNFIDTDDLVRTYRMEQQKAYKTFLDGQVGQRLKQKENPKDFEIIRQNPYNTHRYEIGRSALPHNPITNPMNNFQYNKYLYFNNNLLGANSFINQNNERNFNNPSSNTNNTNFIETQTEKVSNPHVARENSNINTNVLSENHLQQNVNMEPQKFPNSYNNPYEGQIGNEQMEHHINNHIDHNLAQPYSIPNHNYRINDQQANADNYNSSYNTSNYLNQNKSLTPYGERLRMAGNNIFR